MASSGSVPVTLTLPSLAPSLVVQVLPHGVTVHRIIVQVDGKTHDVLVGPEDASDFLSPYHKYHNTIIGRYTNRVPVGSHEIERNGFKATVNPQGNQADPKVSLHGGPKGFDDVDWDVLDIFQATLFSDEEKVTVGSMPSKVVFSYTSPDGDQGFPGTLKTEVLIGLVAPGLEGSKENGEDLLGSIVLVYRAALVEEGRVTPVNLTQHWGFNLEASLQDNPASLLVKDHMLTIKAEHHVALDSSALSTNTLTTLSGTDKDHSAKLIGHNFPELGYDEFYVFEKNASVPIPSRFSAAELSQVDYLQDIIRPREKREPAVELSSGKSGIKLAFSTNQSGVQFYSGNFLAPQSARKKIHGGSGSLESNNGYTAGAAAFLEFHEPLAAWMNPATSLSGNDTLLASGEMYNNLTKLDVFYKS